MKKSFYIHTEQDYFELIKRLQKAKENNKTLLIEVSNKTKKTDEQHKYYWVLIDIIAKYLSEQNGCEMTNFETHELIKSYFFSETKQVKVGNVIFESKVVKSMSTANKEEMTILIDKIVKFCNEFDIKIPEHKNLEFNI